MGSMQRNKGARGEREVVAALQEIVDKVCVQCSATRVLLERNTLQAHRGGHDLHGLSWLSLEVKRQENASGLGSWWAQCLRQAEQCGAALPVLAYRSNRQPWRVRMRVGLRVLPGKPRAGNVVATVDIDWETFLVFFEARMRAELEA